jgi:hypothetical protein
MQSGMIVMKTGLHIGSSRCREKKIYQEILDFLNSHDDDAPYTLYMLRKKIKEELDKD